MGTADSRYILWAGLMIDNVNPLPLTNSALVISGGVIQRIINGFDQDNYPELVDYQLMDLREHAIIPGLIDCHVHLALEGTDFKASVSRWSEEADWLPQVKQSLDDTRKCGIVAVRDGGDNGLVGLRAKQLIQAGTLQGPVILSCGQAITKQGLYGSFLGPGVTDIIQAYEIIDRNLERGADWIKVVASGIVSFREYGKVGALQFNQDELKAIVSYAHAKGMPVMAHASSDEAVSLAVRAGVDSIEHGYFISSQSLERMAEQRISWVPTVVPVAAQMSQALPESAEIIKRTYQLQLEKIALAHDLKVNIGVGTDAGAGGAPHGYAYWQELELFAEAGLSNLDVIRAATINSARICGLDNQLGSLEPGKWACVVAVKGNPLENLAALRKH